MPSAKESNYAFINISDELSPNTLNSYIKNNRWNLLTNLKNISKFQWKKKKKKYWIALMFLIKAILELRVGKLREF